MSSNWFSGVVLKNIYFFTSCCVVWECYAYSLQSEITLTSSFKVNFQDIIFLTSGLIIFVIFTFVCLSYNSWLIVYRDSLEWSVYNVYMLREYFDWSQEGMKILIKHQDLTQATRFPEKHDEFKLQVFASEFKLQVHSIKRFFYRWIDLQYGDC